MPRKTPETLLLSAIVNCADVKAFNSLEVSADAFDGHRGEFEWITAYVRRFNRVPSPLVLSAKFPELAYFQDYLDMEWSAEEVLAEAAKRNLTALISQALDMLDRDQVAEAYGLLGVPSQIRGSVPVDGLVPLLEGPSDKPAIAVPWKTLQSLTDGIGAGDLWYIAARPGQGKSAILLYLTAAAAVAGQRVVYYSLEMTARSLQERLYTILAQMLGIGGVTHTALRRRHLDPIQYRALAASITEALPGSVSVYTPAQGSCTPSVVGARANDYDLSVVDYMGLMRASTGKPAVEDWRVLAQVSNELKQVALASDTRILAASQINREGDGGSRRRAPRLRNLAGSDALAQDGDVIVTMNRHCSGALNLSLEKNRHGESEVVWYAMFDPDVGVFSEITRSEADALADMDEDN